MNVIIGVDQHKASHTAVAIDSGEDELSRLRVRSSRRQVEQLLVWAAPFEKRTWAIESAGGMGYLLAQQLVAAGEDVVDVPAMLASRVRVLASGRSNKNDPNDALSVAVAALRAGALRPVALADDVEVLRLLAKRNSDIGSQRTRVVSRLHAMLCDLAPGGMPRDLSTLGVETFLRRGSIPSPPCSGPAMSWPSSSSRSSVVSTLSSRSRTGASARPSSPRAPPSRNSSASDR